MTIDHSAQRREDIAEQLTVAAGLLDERGWAGTVEQVLTQAMERLAVLELDEFQERFETATARLTLAEKWLEGDYTKAAGLCLIDDLFSPVFDPQGWSRPRSDFETDEETVARIERSRRFEAGE